MPGAFFIGDWRVDPSLHCITGASGEIRLEPKVMQVLVELAEHPGQAVSKDRLLHTVWADTFVGDEVLARAISELRRVFGDDPKAPRVIQTIPKGGYRLIAPVRFDGRANQNGSVTLDPHAARVLETGVRAKPLWRGAAALLIAAAFVALVALVIVWNVRPAPTQAPVRRFSISLGSVRPVISPDGQHIAYRLEDRLWIRDLESETPRELPGRKNNWRLLHGSGLLPSVVAR